MLPADLSTRRAGCLVLATAASVLGLSGARGGLPEPDTVFYGTIAIDNAYVTASDVEVTVELRRTADGPAVTSYRMGDLPQALDAYSLRARVESAPPLSDPTAFVLGSTVWITVSKDGTVRHTASRVLDARGTFVALNFGDLDSDGDGMLDGFELTHFGSPTAGLPNQDPDGDYRSNRQEALDGTDPLVADGRHPADAAPADWLMTLGEVTSYAAAWLRGDPWPTGPQPTDAVLVDFVTAAGTLWLGGERYVFDNDPVTTPPRWWTNAPPSPALASAGASEPVPRQRRLATASAGLQENTVRRSSSAPLAADVPTTVTLTVTPSESVRVYAVEERLPSGWSASRPSANGSLDNRLNHVRWGPFFDNTPRSFTYTVTPASLQSASFDGAVSFDGQSRKAEGLVRVGAEPEEVPLTLQLSGRLPLTVEITGAPGVRLALESSSDFRQWTDVGSGTTDAQGRLVVAVPGSTVTPVFFRARRTSSTP